MVSLLALGACGKSEECTAEIVQQKSEAMAKAVQDYVAKDPLKAPELLKLMEEVTTKHGGNDLQAACKAIDEIMEKVKQ